MYRSVLISLALMLILAGLVSGQAEKKAATQVLVECEHAFAKMAADKNTRAAFLEFLADDGVVFQPGLAEGKKSWQSRPENSSLLSWQPAFADIAASGELGYTTGPWEYRKNKSDEKPIAYGNYVTLWQKQPNGQWRVMIDLGIGTPPPTSIVTEVASPNSLPTLAKSSSEVEKIKLLKVDEAGGRSPNGKDVLLDLLAEDARLMRDEQFPFIGKNIIKDYLQKQDNFSWQPLKAAVAQSGDLGYSYGTINIAHKDSNEKGYYVRFWRKQGDGNWKIVLDITSLLPKE